MKFLIYFEKQNVDVFVRVKQIGVTRKNIRNKLKIINVNKKRKKERKKEALV